MKGKKHRSKKKIILLAAAILLVAIAVPLGIVWSKFLAATKDQVPIVERVVPESTPQVNESNAPAPQTPAQTPEEGIDPSDPSVQAVEGTPDDIHEDVQVYVPEPSEAPIYKQVPIDENIINILLLGSDARPGEKGGRSDTMMLFSYNREAGKVSLLSFMRDSWVQIDGHSWNRINAAYAFGGVGLSINTINENFGLDVQNYVTIGFEEFIKAVDEIGGIELTLSQKEADYINKQYTSAVAIEGKNLVNGAQTLIHARNRHVGNGDFERTRRQREVLGAIFSKLKTVRDPSVLLKVFDILIKNVKTNVSPDLLFTLMNEIISGKNIKLTALRMPFDATWHYAMKDKRSVLSINIKKNAALIHTMLYE